MLYSSPSASLLVGLRESLFQRTAPLHLLELCFSVVACVGGPAVESEVRATMSKADFVPAAAAIFVL